jgi:hypothetical protein
MRTNINAPLHIRDQDDFSAEFMGSPNASLASSYDTDAITRENKSLAVDNEIRSSLSDTLSDRNLLWNLLSDTSSDRNLLWNSISDARFILYQKYLYQENLDREYELHQQTSEVRLNEVCREAEEAYTLDNEIDQIPKTAYDDALVLLKRIFRAGIPMPEFSWAEDGSLSLTWFPREGIATMGIYGDNLVIYTAFFEEKRQIEGICELSDTPMLSGFLTTLSNILFK